MSKNICVLTGARDSGMCKIYGYLRENGVNITGFHERCDLMDDTDCSAQINLAGSQKRTG